MTRAYSELYLEDAMRTLGEAADYAFSIGEKLDEFLDLFLAGGYSTRYENGEPQLISGLSGIELAMKILHDQKGRAWEDFPEMKPRFDFSKEYWCGHILAYYQWSRNISFKEIFDHLSIEEVMSLYPSLHEASEERAAYAFDRIISSKRKNKLSILRKINGLTQKELSEKAGVSLRSIQQYEIGAKDINKASSLTVRNLSRALHCQIEDLLSVPLPFSEEK